MRTRASACAGRRQQLERQGEQRVARQDAGPFVEGLVHGGLAAAQIVVVHGRQIVMNERIAVHALERRRRLHRGLGCNAEQAGALQHQKGTQPLATAQSPQPHGLDQPMWGATRGRIVETRGKPRFDESCRTH